MSLGSKLIDLISFLGYVDLRGTTYQTTTIATGFGAHLAQPILRKRVEGREDDLTEEEAIEIINDCMKVLFYRDARSMNKASGIDFLCGINADFITCINSSKEQRSLQVVLKSLSPTAWIQNGDLQKRYEDTVHKHMLLFHHLQSEYIPFDYHPS